MNEVRFGIIGCGVVAPTHAVAINEINEAKLVAVADISEARAKGFAEKYGAKYYYSDYHKILRRNDIDAVNICTPHYLHARMAIDAAKAGKHIVVEKPMAVTMAEADKMLGECEKARVKLCPIFQHRFDPAAQCVRKAIDEGRLGKLVMGNSYTKWYRSDEYFGDSWRGKLDESAGGALINQAIHMVDLLIWFMGPVDTICANIATVTHPIEVEDVAVASMKFKNGAIGTMEASVSTVPNMPERLEISGSEGTVVIEGSKLIRWDIGGESLEQMQQRDDYFDSRFQGKSYYGNSHPKQIENFVQAIIKDETPYIDGKEARKTLELVLGIYESARNNKYVKLC